MEPLIISPCPRCLSDNVSRFSRVRLLSAFDNQTAVRCEDCGDIRPVNDESEAS